jgi:hypothetical protein
MAALAERAGVAKPQNALILIFFLPTKTSGPGLRIGRGISYVKEFNGVILNTICKGLKIREIWRGNFATHSIVYIAGNRNFGDKNIELR